MRSTIHTIKNKIYEKHPEISSEEIDTLIQEYFSFIKEVMWKPPKYSVSVPWAILDVCEPKWKSEKNRLTKLLNLFIETKDRIHIKPFVFHWFKVDNPNNAIKYLTDYTDEQLIEMCEETFKYYDDLIHTSKRFKIKRTIKSGKFVGRTAKIKQRKLEKNENR